MRRRRRVWRSLALSSAVAACVPMLGSPAASAPPKPGPDVHVAGIGLDGPVGAPRTNPIPHLVRVGSHERAAPSSSAGTIAPRPLAPIVVPPVFEGVDDKALVSPADPTGALGVTNHVAAVNVHMASFARDGTELFAPKRLRTLDPALPGGIDDFDPRVVYDPYPHGGQHFFLLSFASATVSKSFLSIVVIPEGAEDDPSQAGWCTLHLAGDQVEGNGNLLADYPQIGFSAGRVTLTTNQFDIRSLRFRYVQIVSIRKADLYDCAVDPVPIKVFSGRTTRDPDGSHAFTIMPAISVGGDPMAQYLTSIDFNGVSGKLILWRLKFTNGVGKLKAAQVAASAMAYPPFGLQCEGSAGDQNTWWDTGDLRITSALWDADLGRLYTATSVRRNLGGGASESVIKWWEVNPATSLGDSDVTRGGVVGTPGRYAAWPSVATDASGNLWVNYARAGTAGVDECLSAYAAVVHPGTTTASQIAVQLGEDRYNYAVGDIERWGDYTSISRDPVDGTTVAAYGAIAQSDGSGTSTIRWQQVIGTLQDV
jgi:hypothetical protein